jgi:hypothetical protein
MYFEIQGEGENVLVFWGSIAFNPNAGRLGAALLPGLGVCRRDKQSAQSQYRKSRNGLPPRDAKCVRIHGTTPLSNFRLNAPRQAFGISGRDANWAPLFCKRCCS